MDFDGVAPQKIVKSIQLAVIKFFSCYLLNLCL